MKLTKAIGMLAGLSLLFVSKGYALDVGLGVKAGTLGYGFDASVVLTKTINARISMTNLNVDDVNETITVGDANNSGDVDATLGMDFGSSALLFDWYVFDGTFHLTAGMLKNNARLAFNGVLQNDIVVNGQNLSSNDINGAMTGAIALGDSFQPYVGFGWGRKASDDSGFSISLEIGVGMLDPKSDISAQVNAGGINALNQAELDSIISDVENDIDNELTFLTMFPVLSLGINYAF